MGTDLSCVVPLPAGRSRKSLALKDNFKKMRGKIITMLWMLAGLVAYGPRMLWAQIPEKEMARLKKGNVITFTEKDPGTGDRVAVGRAIFTASQELAWKVLTNYASYPEFLSDVKELKITKRDGNKLWIRVRFRNLFPFPDFKCQALVEEFPSEGRLKITMEQGDFDQYYASWKLSSLDSSKILAEYRLYRYVGWWWFPFVPSTLTNESMASDQLQAFRKQVKLVQDQKVSQPGDVIKPIWRKSIFKDKSKEKPKGAAQPAKESKPESKAEKK